MGLYISAAGILNALRRQEITAHNVANMSTPGYRAARAISVENPGGGARVAEVARDDAPGPLEITGQPLDIAGSEGFFRVRSMDGSLAYTRDGHFGLNAEGYIVTAEGAGVDPPIQAPPGASRVTVSRDGTVTALLPGQSAAQAIGRIAIFRFPNPGGLAAIGANLFKATAASGEPQEVSSPPEFVVGAVQGSNVNLAVEQVAILLDRRSFEANVNALRVQDELLGELLDIRS